MNKRIALVCLLVAGIAVVLLISILVMDRAAQAPIVVEDYIVAKTTRDEISSQWTPVMLYVVTKDRARGKHFGCGTFYTSTEGELVITCEHLFPVSEGVQDVAFRKLRPFESDITHGIEKVLWKGDAIAPGTKPDVVVLKVGDIQPIQFYSHQPIEVWSETQAFRLLSDPIVLTSLISGEKVRLVGFAQSTMDQGVLYGVIEYHSLSGESGTGFVDDNGSLFILKGTLTPDSDPTGGQIDVKGGLSFVYGPISVKK